MFVDQLKVFFITITRRRIFVKIFIIFTILSAASCMYAGYKQKETNYFYSAGAAFNVMEKYATTYLFYGAIRAILPVILIFIICKYISDFYHNRFYLNEIQDKNMRWNRNLAESFGFIVILALLVALIFLLVFLFSLVTSEAFLWRDFPNLLLNYMIVFIVSLFSAVLPSIIISKITRSLFASMFISLIYYIVRGNTVLIIYNTVKRFFPDLLINKVFAADRIEFQFNSTPYYVHREPVPHIYIKALVIDIIIRLALYCIIILLISKREEVTK